MIKYKKINHDIYPLLQKTKEYLQDDPDIIFAYCFGSYGKGKPHPLSDIDIAVYLKPEIKDVFTKKLALHEILSKILLTDEIDIVVLNSSPISLAIEVLQTGRPIMSKDQEKQISFEVKIIKEYLDTLWLREIEEANLINRIKEGRYGITRIG